jgi:AAA family ATP:ADP antiporter
MTIVSKMVAQRYAGNDDKAFEVSLKVLSGMMTAAGGIVALLYGLIQRLAASERAAKANADAKVKTDKPAAVEKKKKPELSFMESLTVLTKDKYLSNIATMVLAYGLTMEFTEIIWKATVKAAYPVSTAVVVRLCVCVCVFSFCFTLARTEFLLQHVAVS